MKIGVESWSWNPHGRDAEVGELSGIAEIGIKRHSDTARGAAPRSQSLALLGPRPTSDAFRIDARGRRDRCRRADGGAIVFDADDIDAAIAELDARYLAGEAAAHAHTWTIVGAYAAINRHEIPPTTPDCVNIDHRRETAFGPLDLTAYQKAGLELDQGIDIYVEKVHQLNDRGAVITYAAHENSPQGFDAEWRGVAVFTVSGDLVNRVEVFDEADLDAALTRFEELQPHAPRLENAASQVTERFQAHFAARDWAAMGEILADGFSSDDRRRVVGAGVRDGRQAEIADMAATADLGVTHATSTVLATRGGRLALMRGSFTNRDQGPEPFLSEALGIVEIDGYERIVAFVTFDLDDFDAAIAELDARFLAGEAAAHAHTWSVITGCFAALSRHELPATTPDLIDIDHRRGTAFASGELLRYLRAGWELNQSTRAYVAEVHRLNDFGAVVTHAADLTSREGLEAEWRDRRRLHRRRRPDQPLRALRRGRPRRRARAIR